MLVVSEAPTRRGQHCASLRVAMPTPAKGAGAEASTKRSIALDQLHQGKKAHLFHGSFARRFNRGWYRVSIEHLMFILNMVVLVLVFLYNKRA